MLVLDCDVEVCEHGHVAEFYLLFLGEILVVRLSVFFDIEERSFDGFDGLVVHRQLAEDDAFVDVGGGYGLEGVLVVLFQQGLFDLQSHLHSLQRIL